MVLVQKLYAILDERQDKTHQVLRILCCLVLAQFQLCLDRLAPWTSLLTPLRILF